MGGLPCAKEIIDQGAGLTSQVSALITGLDKSLRCMGATLTLYSPYATPSEEQEDRFIVVCNEAFNKVKQSLETVALLASEIEADVRTRSESPQIDVGRDRPPGRG